MQSRRFFANRKASRQRLLQKMANMRAAKQRLRLERGVAALLEREPKMERWFPLELGVRDKITGETAWTDLRSVRDGARRLAVVLRHYLPAPQSRATRLPIGGQARQAGQPGKFKV